MDAPNFSTAIVTHKSATDVYHAINNVRGWWSEEIEGSTDQLNAVFNYHYEDVHRCRIRITELVPGKKVVWFIEDNFFNFTGDRSEWTGTNVIFDVEEKDGKTQLQMTHQGLTPEYECYEICKGGWTNYIQNSLLSLITTGTGKPNASGKPQTKDEERLGSSRK